MSTIKFETGIEPPSHIKTENRFRGMQPGESAFLPQPDSKMLHREFKEECKRNKWHSAAEARTENGIEGIRVWRVEKPRTATETDDISLMQLVSGVLSESHAALTTREIARKCWALGKLGTEDRVRLMEAMVDGGLCTEEKTARSTAYRARQ